MSSIFTIFTSTETYSDSSKAMNAVIDKDLKTLNQYNGSLNNIRDSQANNLLHLATLNEHYEIVKYLLSKSVDKNYKNKFGLTPYEYAIRSHNKELIKLYHEDNPYKIKNDTLIADNKNLSNENVILKRNNKRLREENDELEVRLTKLVSENDELTQANKKLKISVDSLTKAMRR